MAKRRTRMCPLIWSTKISTSKMRICKIIRRIRFRWIKRSWWQRRHRHHRRHRRLHPLGRQDRRTATRIHRMCWPNWMICIRRAKIRIETWPAPWTRWTNWAIFTVTTRMWNRNQCQRRDVRMPAVWSETAIWRPHHRRPVPSAKYRIRTCIRVWRMRRSRNIRAATASWPTKRIPWMAGPHRNIRWTKMPCRCRIARWHRHKAAAPIPQRAVPAQSIIPRRPGECYQLFAID